MYKEYWIIEIEPRPRSLFAGSILSISRAQDTTTGKVVGVFDFQRYAYVLDFEISEDTVRNTCRIRAPTKRGVRWPIDMTTHGSQHREIVAGRLACRKFEHDVSR